MKINNNPLEQFERLEGEEIVAQREEYAKVYDLGLGRRQAVVFAEPVHYRDADGAWRDIDNTLDEAEDAEGRAVLRNRANAVSMEFVRETGEACISRGGQSLRWRVKNGGKTRDHVTGGTILRDMRRGLAEDTPQYRRGDLTEKLNTLLDFFQVRPGLNVRYGVTGDRVKEDLILDNAQAVQDAVLLLPAEYTYTVDEDQRVHVLCGPDELFLFDCPYTYDAENHTTIARVTMEEDDEGVAMRYTLDEDYLASAVFPVTIDPVINSTNPVHNIQDTTLTKGSTAKPYTNGVLKVGISSSKRNVALLKFNHLAVLPASDTVIGAVLQIRTKSSSTSKYIAAYEVLKPWESANINWASFNPDDGSNISNQALECVPGKSSDWLSFDLTNLYRKWCTRNAAGATNNNGVAFRTPLNISGDNYSELYSSDASTKSYRPTMYVNYISHAGLEGWWQYEQMSAGRAGTVYADLFNGNMVLEHSDTAMSGNRNPVSVSHFYNSCLSQNNSFNCGFGWKTDAHQKVTSRAHNSRNYLVWEDGDGTEHFFDWSGSQPYKDNEGMDLEMSFSSDGSKIFIYDKEHNGLRFKVVKAGLAWLEATTDAVGNVSTYSYVSGYEEAGRLDKITDCVGRVTQFTYSGDLLSNIRIPAASGYRYVYFTYDSAKRLTGVRYGELGGTSAHTVYTYDGSTGLLTSARNYDGVRVNVGYEALSLYGSENLDQARRVLSLETASATASGAKQLFDYKHMCTEVTAVDTTGSNAGKTLHYQFNDAGNVVCVRDDLGYARFTKFDSGIANKPSAESPLRRAVVNLLRHPDLSANWTAAGTTAKDTASTCLGVPSVKLTALATGESYYRQEVTLEPNTKYTLSAYVKTQNVTGAFGAYVRLSKKSNVFENVCSTGLFDTTAAALGNGMASDGWERVCVTLDHTASASETYYADLVIAADSGYAWFACPQLETGGVMNPVNLLSNGDFRHTVASGAQILPADWSKAKNTLSTATTGVFSPIPVDAFPSALSGKYLAIEGVPNKGTYVGFVQVVNVSGKSGDIFTLGGWADSHSIPLAGNNWRISFLFRVKKTDGTWTGYTAFAFNPEWVGWQFGCFAAAASADYTQVELTICYVGNCNVSKFSNIFLYREAFGESFAYDDDKNLIATGNLAGQKSSIQYDTAKNITAYTQPGLDASVGDNQHWFYYGGATDAKKHLLRRSRTPMHVTDYYSYDSHGNTTASRRVDYRVYTEKKADNAYPYIRTENTYTDNGNYLASTKDARGNTVTQSVNLNDGTLTNVTDPTGQTVNYTYDASKRVTAVQTTGDGKTYKNAYTYENDRIKTVSHNTNSDTSNDVTYTFAYDSLGRKTTVKVGTQELSKNVYENNRNGLLSEVQYGNGGKVKYTYDGFDRLTGVRYDEDASDRYTYEYGANGQASEVTDNEHYRTVRTDYDLADRPCQTEHIVVGEDGPVTTYRTRLKYDKLNNLAQFSEDVGDETHKSDYVYDQDNRVKMITYDGGAHKVSYAYDELGRVTSRTAECGVTAGKVASTYGYVDGGYGTNSTTPLVASITQPGASFAYTYDSRGNIISEKRGTLTTTYAYDALGQLIRVNDPHENATWVYNYDRGGNITSKVKYAYTTGALGAAQQTISYDYDDSNWKDKLTAYNGKAISYDAIGNPLSDGTWTYAWEVGRQLQSMSKSGMNVCFSYDHNGLRTEKLVEQNGTYSLTSYTLHGKLITHMVHNADELHFFYDAENVPAFVDYNGTRYTYITSLHRDVSAILDSSGKAVVEYKYDAWGRLTSTTGSLASTLGKLNPFRYRGNVYDEETGLYYIQSRYFSPEWLRFLNKDDDDSVDVSAGLLSSHPFLYCKNNPVKFIDSNGKFINMIAGAIAGGIVGAVTAALSGDNVLAAAATGAAAGAIAGIAVDVAVAMGGVGAIVLAGAAGAIANGGNYAATELINGRSVDGGVLAIEMATGALSNVFTFALSGGTLKRVGGKIWENMKDNYKKTLLARTTRRVAGRVVRKSAQAVVKKKVQNLSIEAGVSLVVATAAVGHSKFYQRVFLPE